MNRKLRPTSQCCLPAHLVLLLLSGTGPHPSMLGSQGVAAVLL